MGGFLANSCRIVPLAILMEAVSPPAVFQKLEICILRCKQTSPYEGNYSTQPVAGFFLLFSKGNGVLKSVTGYSKLRLSVLTVSVLSFWKLRPVCLYFLLLMPLPSYLPVIVWAVRFSPSGQGSPVFPACYVSFGQ